VASGLGDECHRCDRPHHQTFARGEGDRECSHPRSLLARRLLDTASGQDQRDGARTGVRCGLYCQVEPFFTPVYEAKRNHQVQTFHSLWVASFGSRHKVGSCAEVCSELPLFLRWSRHEYRPRAPRSACRGVPGGFTSCAKSIPKAQSLFSTSPGWSASDGGANTSAPPL
jgi:hypothetical protein